MDLKVGNTPVAIMSNFIFCKMENKNPSGSISDRIVEFSINVLKNEGKIKISNSLIAVANDDLAVSFSFFCAKRGFNCYIVTNKNNNPRNLELCEFFGAEIKIIDSDNYSDLLKEMNKMHSNLLNGGEKNEKINFFDENLINKCYNNSISKEIKHQVSVYGKNLKNIFLFKEDYILAESLKNEFPKANLYAIDIKNNFFSFDKKKKKVIKSNNLFDSKKIKKDLFHEIIDIKIDKVLENIKEVAKKSGLFMDYKTSATYLAAKETPCFNNDISLIFFYENGERYLEELKKIAK